MERQSSSCDDPPSLPNEAQEVLQQFEGYEAVEREQFLGQLVQQLGRLELVSVVSTMRPMLQRDFIAELPEEIAERILSYLDFRSLATCERVSRGWLARIQIRPVWRSLVQRTILNVESWRLLLARRPGSLPPLLGPSHQWKETFRSYHENLETVRAAWRSQPPKESTIDCRGNGIYCLQYDDEKIISGSRDQTIKVWDIHSHRCIKQLTGHTASVLCLQFDDEKIITGSSDATVRVWDLATGECMSVLREHTLPVLSLRFDQNRLVTCSKDESIIVWRPVSEGGQLQYVRERTLLRHRAAVNVVEFDDEMIVSASGDRTIRLWDTDTGRPLQALRGHDRGIACLQFRSPYIVSGSSDQTIRIWHAHTATLLNTLRGHTALVRCLRFNDEYIVSGSYDRSVRVWDFKTGAPLQVFQKHTNRVFRLQFDAFKIVSSSQDDQIRIWDFDVLGAAKQVDMEEEFGFGAALEPREGARGRAGEA